MQTAWVAGILGGLIALSAGADAPSRVVISIDQLPERFSDYDRALSQLEKEIAALKKENAVLAQRIAQLEKKEP